MFGRIRRLEISLAAKCQILFGAAVVLIIAAALLVPWQRMEQLTGELDEQAAAALADDAIARHIAAYSLTPMVTVPAPPSGSPPTTGPTLGPSTAPSTPDESDEAGDDDPAFSSARLHAPSAFESWITAHGNGARNGGGAANGSAADAAPRD